MNKNILMVAILVAAITGTSMTFMVGDNTAEAAKPVPEPSPVVTIPNTKTIDFSDGIVLNYPTSPITISGPLDETNTLVREIDVSDYREFCFKAVNLGTLDSTSISFGIEGKPDSYHLEYVFNGQSGLWCQDIVGPAMKIDFNENNAVGAQAPNVKYWIYLKS
jgi:hypothetical protein